MITGELKNKVDSIWDTIWTGGITSPITVLEQITYLMFMKLLDDNQLKAEANANVLGVPLKNKVFREGVCVISENPRIETDYRNLRWNVFHNFEPGEMLTNIQTYVFPFIKTIGEGKDTAFSRYMKDTVFLIPTAKVLAKVVDGIDSMDMNNKDIMGDVYEYLLGKIAAAGENGQFRTPRHIIDMMVQLMRPTLKDKILDPAMGSAGFLLSSAAYIGEHQKNDLMKRENLSYFKAELFSGFDTDQSMLRIGAMNMMLHGVEDPRIIYQDSLSGDNAERDAYTLIMSNPPFTGSVFQEEISKDLLALTKTRKTELLFCSLFIKMLKAGGRCASIVPDGVLFGSSKAHRELRKELVEDQQLIAVISMPSGVFKPYAGVSTAILIFIKTNAGGTDKVWFYDMHSDGFSLDDKRTPVAGSDIPDIVARFHNLAEEAGRERTEQSFLVPREEIAANGYDLSINKYKKTEYVPVEYPPISEILAQLREIKMQISKGLEELEETADKLAKAQQVLLVKDYPVKTISAVVDQNILSARKVFKPTDTIKYVDISSIDSNNNRMTGFTEYSLKDAPSRAQQCLKKDDILISTVRPNLRNVARNTYFESNIVASSGFCILRPVKCTPEYLLSIVCSDAFTNAMVKRVTGANYPAIKNSDILNYQIIIPPEKEMKQITLFMQQMEKCKLTIQQGWDKLEMMKKALMQEYFFENER